MVRLPPAGGSIRTRTLDADGEIGMELTDRNRQILWDVAQGVSPVESQDKRGLNSLSFQNIRTLLPGCWLSDEVIDEYL